MITSNTKSNINSNKVLVDKYNTQMTTQKKINKPSEDPVVAIRSLRMQTTLSHLDQYLDNNISDVSAWLEVTDTALENIKTVISDIRTQCVNGSTDTLTEDDRNTILQQLQQMADQIYCEGNADYAGRTVFTGYRTSSQLTFQEEETDTVYTIDQSFTYQDLQDKRYYYGESEVPADATGTCTTEIGTHTYSRIRLGYDDIDSLDQLSIKFEQSEVTVDNVVAYDDEAAWEKASATKELGAEDVIFIKSTGELIFGETISNNMAKEKVDISLSYTKTGFDAGEARPEYYYDCTMKTSQMAEAVTYTKENQEINFVISTGITITANTQASDVLDTSIGRDVNELIDIVSTAINAHDKVSKIKEMMKREQFADDDSQANLQTYLDAAEKEAAYADDNLQKTYSQYITNFENYLEKANMAQTNVGSLENRLSLTQTRVENQKATVEELKTNNDNRDISDIIIDYYAAYNAYTASLTAAAKVGQQTLLNYL
jgi:flagellar hook-associated protein 3 FlgL